MYVLRTTRPLRRGEQICISYGDLTPRDCLENYGFWGEGGGELVVQLGPLVDVALAAATDANADTAAPPLGDRLALSARASACCAGVGFTPGPAGPATLRARQRALAETALEGAPALELRPLEGGGEPAADAMQTLRLLCVDDDDFAALGGGRGGGSSLAAALERPVSRANELRALRLLHAALICEAAAGAELLLRSGGGGGGGGPAAAPPAAAVAAWARLASPSLPAALLEAQAEAVRAALAADDVDDGCGAAANGGGPGSATVTAEAPQAAAAPDGCPCPWDGLLLFGDRDPSAAGPPSSSVSVTAARRQRAQCARQYRRGRLRVLLQHLCYVARMLAVAAGDPPPAWAAAAVSVLLAAGLSG